MTDEDRRIPLALIPTRQPITVVASLIKLLGAALIGTNAAMAPGNSADVASTLLSGDTDPNVLAGRLYAAAQVLGADLSEDEIALIDEAADAPRVERADEAAPSLTIGHQTAGENGSVDITFGVEEGEVAANLAHQVLAAFMPLAERMGVENYLEYEGVDRSTGRRALLTFHVPGGKRPSALHREAVAERDQLKARIDVITKTLQRARHMMATDSRDWSLDRSNMWLYGLIVGWECEEQHEHDDVMCGGDSALREVAAQHGGDADDIARIRRFRAALQTSPHASLQEASGEATGEAGGR